MRMRLIRRPEDARIAGVCGGIARRLRLDPVVVRLTFVAAFLAGFLGVALVLYAPLRAFGLLGMLVSMISVPLYVLLWIAMPREQQQSGNRLVPAFPAPGAEPWIFDPRTGERMSN